MSSTTVLEELIEMISAVREIVGKTHVALSELSETIQAERHAVSLHNLNVMEDIAHKKRLLVETIAANFSSFEVVAKRAISQFEAPNQANILTLRGWTQWIREAVVSSSEASLPRQIAEHQIVKLQVAVEELLANRRRIDSLIHQNKYLLETCLRNYQLSFRFWVNVNDETAATYGPTGALQDKRSKSFLTVKA
jgi:hypothetical protein